MVAVGAASSVLIVLGVLHVQRSGVGGPATATSAAGEADIPQGQDRIVAEPARQRVDASSVPPARGVVAEASPPVAVLLPNQLPATPMSEALEDLQMPPIPELLETEQEFAAQSRDPVWSTATEAHVLGQIAGIQGLALASLNVECRTTLCRLQLVLPGTVPGLPSAIFPGPKLAAPGSSGIVEIVNSTGLKARWSVAVRDRYGAPVSLAYLARGETVGTAADAPAPAAQ